MWSMSTSATSDPSIPLITEVAPDTYRISIYVPRAGFQFNHFLVLDEEPLLYATGLKAMFPLLHEAVARLLDPTALRWIGFSYFESDECGSLNSWLELAPAAQPLCGEVGAVVRVNDFAERPARALLPDETLATGKYRFRYRPTPHLPHGWDSGMLFEETHRTLLCSDLFFQYGNVEPLISFAADLGERAVAALQQRGGGPLADATPYTTMTEAQLHGLADLRPRTLAVAHGSSFAGNGEQALRDLHIALRDTFAVGSRIG
jgi:flavorubredoxin